MSIMDPLVVDEALSACLEERDWEGGLDNDGLDISQLESYINNDDNDTMYFGDLQACGEVKTTGNLTLRDPPPTRLHQHHHQHQHHHHQHLHSSTIHQQEGTSHHPYYHHHHHHNNDVNHADLDTGTSSSATNYSLSGSSPSSMSYSLSGSSLSSMSYNFSGSLVGHGEEAPGVGASEPIAYSNPYQHSYQSTLTGHHHLPDSPPDSGSEPPYSPPDHPSLSPHEKNSVTVDPYNQPQVGGNGGGSMGVMTFPYSGIHPQPLPHQHSPTHTSVAPQAAPSVAYQPAVVVGNAIHNGIGGGGGTGAGGNLAPTPPPCFASQGIVGSTSGGGTVGGGTSHPSAGDGVPAGIAGKKRKMNDPGGLSNMVNIKQEPDQGVTSHLGPNIAITSYSEEDEYTMDSSGGNFMEGSYQCIRFQNFQQHTWSLLCDGGLQELPQPTFRVDADKGFNFSNPDESFVCQKKNHFQVTVHIQTHGEPIFIKSPDGLKKIDRFYVHFFGVKTESPSHVIRVEQSQSDRSKKAFHPVPVDLKLDQVSKITVGRLHFSETTSNNMRKKGKPNPDQRYFFLVVSLKAHCGDSAYPIAAQASEKIIVRASNPGQFESDVEYTFQRGTLPESIYHMGRVGVNTDRPDEALVIHGNLKITGQFLQPSDKRAKRNVSEVDTKEQLKNVQSLRVVKYAYKEEFAKQAGLQGEDVYDTGVIAQEVKEVIPEAVKTTGDVTLSNGEKINNFLLVNKERIFMENVGAVKELCKVTGNLENRIGELERMNKKISQLKRFESFKSTTSSVSTRTSATSRVSSVSQRGRGCSSRRHKQLGAGPDDGMCNNKTLQVTTITLVCIMAFCLMAMATIYFLDYQSRRNDFDDIPSTTTTETTIFLETSMSTSTVFRPSPTTQSPTTTENGSLTSVTFTTKPPHTSTTTTTTLPPHPPILGMPENCHETMPGEEPICKVFCCPTADSLQDSRSPVDLSPSTAATSITVTRRVIQYGTTTLPPTMSRYSEVITNKLSTSDPNIVNDSTTQTDSHRLKPIPIKKSASSHDQLARLALHRARMNRPSNSRSIKQTLSKRSIHRKRSTESSITHTKPETNTNTMIPTINIVEFNKTISKLYCLNASIDSDCRSNTGTNYTYALPISRFMPQTNLTLQFSFMPIQTARRPYFCMNTSDNSSSYPFQQCAHADSGEVFSPDEIVEHDGESGLDHYVTLVNVGLWYQVAYKFRIPIQIDENPCESPAANLGQKFYELNFIFQRVC